MITLKAWITPPMDIKFPFRFEKYAGTVTNEMLNTICPELCKSFKTEEEARDYTKGKKNVYLCRLVNYHDKDVLRIGSLTDRSIKVEIREGAKPFTVAWLVSHYPRKERIVIRKEKYVSKFQ